MPSARLVLALAALAGIVVVVAAAALDRRTMAFTLGVLRTGPAAIVEPGSQTCQQPPIAVPEAFARVRFHVGTFEGRAQPLAVRIVDASGRRTLRRTDVAPGYRDNAPVLARWGEPIAAGAVVGVCIRNDGDARIAIYGGGNLAYRPSDAAVDGTVVQADLALVFERADRRSVLAQVPRMFERASLFRPEWVGPWTFWLLLAGVAAGVPLALARALAAVGAEH